MSEDKGVTKLQKYRIQTKMMRKMVDLAYRLKDDIDLDTLKKDFDNQTVVESKFGHISARMRAFVDETVARKQVVTQRVFSLRCKEHEFEKCVPSTYMPGVLCLGVRCRGHCKHCQGMPDC